MNGTSAILVTGATGFVGRALLQALRQKADVRVIAASRSKSDFAEDIEHRQHDLLDTARTPSLTDVSIIIHTAARVHVMNDAKRDALDAYRAANVAGTIALANAAAKAGVKRFIFLSSIKVNGERTPSDKAFTAVDVPKPTDPYAISKWEAEQALRDLETSTGMEIVIIRPPLVYGPGVKANFRKMMEWLARGIPLPLGAVHNRRSLVYIKNLVSLITLCLEHPQAANQTFLVSDGEDLSTTALLWRVSDALGRDSHLIPVPPLLLAVAARCLGKTPAIQRLCSSLQVDIAHTRATLNWTPPYTVTDGLQETVTAFIATT
jgi:UDP-glucose 4-epimerase